METTTVQTIGWSTILGGIVALIGFIALLLMFSVNLTFGLINDLLSVPSSWLLLPLVIGFYLLQSTEHRIPSLIALVVGLVGFVTTMTGSILLLMQRIDFQTSLLPGIGGFALIGLFILINSLMSLDGDPLPKSLAWMGVLLSITPSLALLGVFWSDRIAGVLGSMTGGATGFEANPLVGILFTLGFISYGGLPIWFILVGRQFVMGKVMATAVGAAV